MMFILPGDKGIEQITGRIYFFHIKEFFAFQMSRGMLPGFPAVRVSRCMAVFYNPIYIKHRDEERASWKLQGWCLQELQEILSNDGFESFLLLVTPIENSI